MKPEGFPPLLFTRRLLLLLYHHRWLGRGHLFALRGSVLIRL